ncbi:MULTISPECIES: MFS transporter [Lelliottia]|jgi:predicted MFS family arabinose efflux permease|uniref:MFS transporter n=1 Tax=Lelliottia aquatilis TaxID=2080838 RepID=A0ABX5A6J3_9ENTR|nr:MULTISPECIES: MFS transporter [Lelliottia]POZ18743.1 MFS transporter [Lelliottia aquatilis]POZ24248.1 MFS transporter [Lelliottia aquatilis]POZ27351.1 MFS transporter [Lelliottia sp. 7254-16]POZ29621.1 MFS transporter [Lelliottia aquatilis]POZ35187.1 MFS transporter [Lelliottia aquatilis]
MFIVSLKRSPKKTDAHWGGVFAMTLCVFVLIASEFMPVSLLTPIARELHITEGLAGQGIAISGALAVLTSLTISHIAGDLNRKYLLLGLAVLMAISGLVIAMAPTYPVYMLGRALIGVVIGGFWSLSAATAIRLVPQHQVPRALAIFNGGNALATVVAAPLGSYLGTTVGWRGAFLCIVPLAIAAFIWLWVSLPTMKSDKKQKLEGTLLRLFSDAIVLTGLLACGLFFIGQFALFTYVRPFLENVTNVGPAGFSLILLAIGAAGFVGTLAVSIFLNARLYQILIMIPLLMATVAGTLLLFGHSIWAVTVLLSLWGLLATAAPTGWWTWIARALPEDAEAGGGLMVAVIQLSIALGSTAGGLVFDSLGWQSAFGLSGLLLLGAAAMTYVTSLQNSKAH